MTHIPDYDAMIASVFHNASEGIIVSNREGKIILINPCAEKMFGYSHDELIGSKIEILLPDTIRQSHSAYREEFHAHPVNRVMGAGRDLYAKKKDDSIFPVEISLSHYEFDGHRFAIAYIIDITIRKQHEQVVKRQKDELEKISKDIKQLNAHLEQKVEDRTIMLRETLAQLQRSKDDLSVSLEKEKELGDLKSRFVSTVSHEFRTPLSTILSSAALIGKYVTSEEQEKRERHILRIKDSVRHMNNMLDDLLSLSKLEEGKVQVKKELIRLMKFMEEFVEEISELTQPGQRIIMDVSGDNEVYTDKRLLKNVLLNLASNAIKFSSEGGEIYIKANNSNDRLNISVTDSGIGISEEDRQNLFERFFRGRNAQNIEGTGLGLHIVTKYLELLDGHIDLESELGKGSTFTITVPSKYEDYPDH